MLRILLLSLLLTSVLLVSCSAPTEPGGSKGGEHKKKSQDKKTETDEAEIQNIPTATSAGECDTALWQRVYDPSRLEVLAACKVVTGTIAEQDQNEDGDTHRLLKLDPGQADRLAK